MSTSLIARIAAFAAAVLLLIVVGCVSAPKGPGRAALEQKGEITLKAGEEKDIYYTTPYKKAPSIELKDEWLNDVKIVECKPDHFRLRNETYGGQIHYVSWTASGERAVTPASAAAPAANITPVTAPPAK